MADVEKKRLRGQTRISAKNQVTLPVGALRESRLKAGDELWVQAEGAGRIVLVRADGVIDLYAGDLTGVYEPGFLDRLRDGWR